MLTRADAASRYSDSFRADRNYNVATICIHPGVTKALYDCFDDLYTIMSSIWNISVTREEQMKWHIC